VGEAVSLYDVTARARVEDVEEALVGDFPGLATIAEEASNVVVVVAVAVS